MANIAHQLGMTDLGPWEHVTLHRHVSAGGFVIYGAETGYEYQIQTAARWGSTAVYARRRKVTPPPSEAPQ